VDVNFPQSDVIVVYDPSFNVDNADVLLDTIDAEFWNEEGQGGV